MKIDTIILALALAACGPATASAPPGGSSPVPEAGAPRQDPVVIAAQLQRATLPASPRQANFTWALDESGARFNGRGVARFRAPDRFRIDLFGPRGETYFAAALVDETPRIPAAIDQQRFRFPSPALLWATVGVVRPPSTARLVDATSSGDATVVRYDLGAEGTLEYRARNGVLQGVRRVRGGGVQESIDLTHGTGNTITSARYREWNALRTLNLTLESTNDAASFSEDIWSPPGTAR
ncbi:MAG TPA: hypothetical protein VK420_06560 [Longimicrobium sp.]|nr:hypothetical protein [Longimicrobium sp.]